MNEGDLAQTRLSEGPQLGEHYRHYKGGECVIVCRSVDEETLEQLVAYKDLAENGIWTRTLSKFTETVADLDSTPPIFVKRFELVGVEVGTQ